MSDPISPDATPVEPSRASGRRTPAASTLLLLNAIFPGLGHLVAGRRAWALLLAAPVLVAVAIFAIAALTGGVTSLAARFIDPGILGLLLVAEGAFLLWHLFSLGAVRVVTPIRATAVNIVAVIVAVAIVVGPQVVLGSVTADARDAAAEIFQPVAEGGAWVPDATPPPVEPDEPDFVITPSEEPSLDPSASASLEPSASPTPEIPRINVLLIGMDSGVGRNTALTDTMIVASLDPVGKTVSMVSIPRDMVDVPLPDGRSFRGKINSLVSYARWNPKKFPGAKDGQSVLAAALGELLNLKIDKWAQVNLGGFVYLVDSVGGVTVNVTDGFCDPRYKEYGIKGFSISPGRYRFDGEQALAYARVRKAAGESDFTRAARQQEVIGALRDKIVKGAFLENPGKFLKSLGQTIQTNINPSFIADWIGVASEVGRKDVFREVIARPLVKGAYDERGSIQVPNIKKIRALAKRLFTPVGVRPEGFETMPAAGSGPTKRAGKSSTCGIAPTPRPTPKATPEADAQADPKPTPEADRRSRPPKPTAEPTPEVTPEVTPDPNPEP